MRKALILALFFLVAVILTAGKTFGQVPQGQVLGVVTDSTGATVPGATLTLKIEGTGLTRTAQTNSSGDYVFLYLDSGTYTMTVQMTGFETAVYPEIQLQIAEKKRVDAQLNVGHAITTVEVKGAAAKLDTDTSAVSSIVSQRAVMELPLAGREFSRLALMMPGVRQETGRCAYTACNLVTQIATSVDVGGTGYSKNAYSMDGVDNYLYAWYGPAINPSLDSVQELKIDRSLYQAEYSAAGAQFHTVTKTGTNAFHGTLWEYVRNYRFNAGDYVSHQKDTLKRNQFGGNIGGPIVKDKAFFFFNWERQREHAAVQQLGTVLTARARGGDLSEYPETPIDPLTGQPFPGKVIPLSRIDPVWLAYMNSMMAPPSRSGILNNLTKSVGYKRDWDQFIGRGDYHPSKKDNLYFRVSIQPRVGVTPNGAYGPNVSPQSENFHFYNGGVGWTRNWTPSLVSETQLGFHHERLVMARIYHQDPQPRIQGFGGQPNVENGDLIQTDYFPLGNYGYPIGFDQRAYNISQNASFVAGKHVVKAGFTMRWQKFFGDLYVEYNTIETFLTTYTRSSLGDLFLGLPTSVRGRLRFPRQDLRVKSYAAFVQDDWKITPFLTLNLGLRYELMAMPYDAHDVWGTFSPELRKIVVAGSHVRDDIVNPFLLNAWKPLIVTADKTNLPLRTLGFGDHNDFGPRIGFAWRPLRNNKTVIRGAYGVYYLPRDGVANNNSQFTAPYFQQLSAFNSSPTPSFTMGAPFGSPVAPAPNSFPFDTNMRTPYLQQIYLGMQRELPGGMVGEIGFQDQNSKKIETFWDINTPVVGPGPINPRRPFWPDFGPGLFTTHHEGHSRYDALELSVKKTSAHYTFWYNHTWAKNMGRGSGSNEGSQIVYPHDRDMFYGPIRYVPHMNKFSFLVDLPAGKGRRVLNQGGVANAVLGGWTVAGIFIHLSGVPSTVSWSGDSANVTIFGVRANRICDGKLSNPTQQQWFDTSCFVAPTPGTFGNSGTGIFMGPRKVFGDFSLLKNFSVAEHVKLQFRTEFFNLFNHMNMADPRTGANAARFGAILTKNSDPRVIQFALRLTF